LESLLWFLTVTVFGIAVLRSKRLSLLAEKDSLKASAPESRSSAHWGLSQGLERAFGSTALVVGIAISLCSWALEILAVYLCVVAVRAAAHFLVVAFILAVVSLGGALTMLPGGIGAAELGIAGMFASIVNLSGGSQWL